MSDTTLSPCCKATLEVRATVWSDRGIRTVTKSRCAKCGKFYEDKEPVKIGAMIVRDIPEAHE